MRHHPYLDLVNMNAYMKFNEILSICSQDIEWKSNAEHNSDINQGPYLYNKRVKNDL